MMQKGVTFLARDKMVSFIFYYNIHPEMKLMSYREIRYEGLFTPLECTGCKDYTWDMKEDIYE